VVEFFAARALFLAILRNGWRIAARILRSRGWKRAPDTGSGRLAPLRSRSRTLRRRPSAAGTRRVPTFGSDLATPRSGRPNLAGRVGCAAGSLLPVPRAALLRDDPPGATRPRDLRAPRSLRTRPSGSEWQRRNVARADFRSRLAARQSGRNRDHDCDHDHAGHATAFPAAGRPDRVPCEECQRAVIDAPRDDAARVPGAHRGAEPAAGPPATGSVGARRYGRTGSSSGARMRNSMRRLSARLSGVSFGAIGRVSS
jgi:hypothetical protein